MNFSLLKCSYIGRLEYLAQSTSIVLCTLWETEKLYSVAIKILHRCFPITIVFDWKQISYIGINIYLHYIFLISWPVIHGKWWQTNSLERISQ